jgi:hypothetical protein
MQERAHHDMEDGFKQKEVVQLLLQLTAEGIKPTWHTTLPGYHGSMAYAF